VPRLFGYVFPLLLVLPVVTIRSPDSGASRADRTEPCRLSRAGDRLTTVYREH
jgi:hypothetical protein